jgi:hypothetical protein
MRFPFVPVFWMSAPFVSRWLRGNLNPLCGGVLGRELDGQTPPTLLAPPTEYLSTPLSFHTRSEPVRTNSTLVAGTICRLTHGMNTPFNALKNELYKDSGKRIANLFRD